MLYSAARKPAHHPAVRRRWSWSARARGRFTTSGHGGGSHYDALVVAGSIAPRRRRLSRVGKAASGSQRAAERRPCWWKGGEGRGGRKGGERSVVAPSLWSIVRRRESAGGDGERPSARADGRPTVRLTDQTNRWVVDAVASCPRSPRPAQPALTRCRPPSS